MSGSEGAGAWRQAPATRPSARASLLLFAAPDARRLAQNEVGPGLVIRLVDFRLGQTTS